MQSTSENMFLELFCQIISEPCFNTLRTKEQLGEWAAGRGRAPHSLRSTVVLENIRHMCSPLS